MKVKWLKYIFLFFLVVLLAGGAYVYKQAMARLAPRPSMLDSPTSFIGFNHIGLSVKNLDQMLEFYQSATDYKVIKNYAVNNNTAANKLYGMDSLSYRRAILKGPNMLLELTEFEHNKNAIPKKMLPQGPGMTHTCYQSHPERPTFDSFKKVGAEILTRGNSPVDNGLGVTYAYAYDPEGNMIELEQMSWTLIGLNIGKSWAKKNGPWMTQVALMSPDLPPLVAFYEKVLEIKPYRMLTLGPSPGLDAIIDVDSTMIESAWFGMDTQGKKMEMMQYLNPVTEQINEFPKLTDLGYSFSFEVGDIQKEYDRLKKAGVNFTSSPQEMEDFWEVMSQDLDGNVFSLRQIKDTKSLLSLKNM